MQAIKEEAIHLIKLLPENCSWDDIIYELYVKKKIESGIEAGKEGRVISHEDVKKRFAKWEKLIWTEPAVNDLQAIFDFISKDSEYYACVFIGEIIGSVEKLTDFPEIGRIVPEYQQNDIREIIVENYRVIYQLEQNRILILTVAHGRRDLTKLMELNEKPK